MLQTNSSTWSDRCAAGYFTKLVVMTQPVPESEQKRNGCTANWHKVLITWTALNTLLSQNAEKVLCRQNHKMYKYANRSGRYLANELINNKSSNKSIDKMKDKHGMGCIIQTLKLLKYLMKYFLSLYTSKTGHGW